MASGKEAVFLKVSGYFVGIVAIVLLVSTLVTDTEQRSSTHFYLLATGLALLAVVLVGAGQRQGKRSD